MRDFFRLRKEKEVSGHKVETAAMEYSQQSHNNEPQGQNLWELKGSIHHIAEKSGGAEITITTHIILKEGESKRLYHLVKINNMMLDLFRDELRIGREMHVWGEVFYSKQNRVFNKANEIAIL